MAIQNKIQFKGLTANSGYSRFVRGSLEISPGGPKIVAQFQDFADAKSATKVLEEVKTLIQPPPEYNPEDPEHFRQYEAKRVTYPETDSGKANWENDRLNWRPTIYVTEQKWLGKTVEPPIQERSVELPLEQALQILQRAVPGKPTDELPDNLVAEFYRAAMASGAFKDPVAI